MYSVRYVHKIRQDPSDIGPDIDLAPSDLESRVTLGKALRLRHIICSGQSIHHFRVESSGRIIAFPKSSIWHCIIITPGA